jgi:hypothetical protein
MAATEAARRRPRSASSRSVAGSGKDPSEGHVPQTESADSAQAHRTLARTGVDETLNGGLRTAGGDIAAAERQTFATVAIVGDRPAVRIAAAGSLEWVDRGGGVDRGGRARSADAGANRQAGRGRFAGRGKADAVLRGAHLIWAALRAGETPRWTLRHQVGGALIAGLVGRFVARRNQSHHCGDKQQTGTQELQNSCLFHD